MFLTNWVMEPRYNLAECMVQQQRVRDQQSGATVAATVPEQEAESAKFQAWLSRHGPRRVYQPKTTLAQHLTADEWDDITNNKATHLRFRARFPSPVPADTVFSRQECQEAIDSSAIFRNTLTEGIRAAAIFDEHDNERVHIMPPLTVQYWCIAVVVRQVTAEEDALVSPHDLDYNSISASTCVV